MLPHLRQELRDEMSTLRKRASPQLQDAQITAPTRYPGREQYGGLKLDQAKRLKDLENGEARHTLKHKFRPP